MIKSKWEIKNVLTRKIGNTNDNLNIKGYSTFVVTVEKAEVIAQYDADALNSSIYTDEVDIALFYLPKEETIEPSKDCQVSTR